MIRTGLPLNSSMVKRKLFLGRPCIYTTNVYIGESGDRKDIPPPVFKAQTAKVLSAPPFFRRYSLAFAIGFWRVLENVVDYFFHIFK